MGDTANDGPKNTLPWWGELPRGPGDTGCPAPAAAPAPVAVGDEMGDVVNALSEGRVVCTCKAGGEFRRRTGDSDADEEEAEDPDIDLERPHMSWPPPPPNDAARSTARRSSYIPAPLTLQPLLLTGGGNHRAQISTH